MTRSHTTATGCTVTVRSVGPSVEIVVRQKDGRTQTFACGWRDAYVVGEQILEASGDAEDNEARR